MQHVHANTLFIVGTLAIVGCVDGGGADAPSTQLSTTTTDGSPTTTAQGSSPGTGEVGTSDTSGVGSSGAGTSGAGSSGVGSSGAGSSGTGSSGAGSSESTGTPERPADDTSSSGGESTGGAPTWTSPCPPYAGLGDVGSSQTYIPAVPQPGYDADMVVVVTDVVQGAVTRVTQTLTIHNTGPNFSSTGITATVFRCDADGASIESAASESQGISNGTPFETSSQTSYDPPYLLVPWGAEVGSSWSASSTVTTTGEFGSTVYELDSSSVVVSEETVSAAAGQFETLRVESSQLDQPVTTAWYEHDVGSVINASWELADVSLVAWP